MSADSLSPYPDRLSYFNAKIESGYGLSRDEKMELDSLLTHSPAEVSEVAQSKIPLLEQSSHLIRKAEEYITNLSQTIVKTKQASQIAFCERRGIKQKDVLHAFESLLGIKQAPHKDLVQLYVEKQEFLDNHTHFLQALSLLNQGKSLPIFQVGIKMMRDNYEKWDVLRDKEKLYELKIILSLQHKNLDELSYLFAAVNPEDIKLLTQSSFDGAIAEVLLPFLEGKKELKVEDKPIIREQIRKSIEELKGRHQESTQELAQKRLQSPISKTAIESQARLFEASRKGQIWSAEQATLTQEGQSINEVYSLKNPDHLSETIAFYKRGKGGERGAGIMERLIWDLSLVMGVEEFFTPTKEVLIRTRDEQKEGTEQTLIWTKEGELIKLNQAQVGQWGGIQASQQGMLLKDYIEAQNVDPYSLTFTISKAQLIDGTLATLVFGMWDAHAKNIIVDQNGVHFFDNTRSLPHANGYIQWANELVLPAYRSGLLGMVESLKPLEKEDVSSIQQKLQTYLNRMKALKQFLSQSNVQSQIEKLPPGWLNVPQSVEAMKQRLEQMQKAVESQQISCLRDLAFAAMPELKFVAALHLIREAARYFEDPIEKDDDVSLMIIQEDMMGDIGALPLQRLLDECVSKGFNPQSVKSWVEDPSLSFEDLITKLSEEYQGIKNKEPTESEVKRLEISKAQVLAELKAQVKLDLKDIPREKAQEEIQKLNSSMHH